MPVEKKYARISVMLYVEEFRSLTWIFQDLKKHRFRMNILKLKFN